jgi:hypothetical protein
MLNNVNPHRPQVLPLRATFWTIGPFSLVGTFEGPGRPPLTRSSGPGTSDRSTMFWSSYFADVDVETPFADEAVSSDA